MVVVDSSVWIQVLRRPDAEQRPEVDQLLAKQEVLLIGPVLAEVLQGTRTEQQFRRTLDLFTPLPYVEADFHTWTTAAAISAELRRSGVQTPLVDILIASMTMEHNAELLTLDDHFRRVPGLKLYSRTGT